MPEEAVRSEEETRLDSPWVTLVWNDPVNLMSYVAYVFESAGGARRSAPRAAGLSVPGACGRCHSHVRVVRGASRGRRQ